MYNNIALFSKQPRAAGTEGEYQAVQYIKSEFERYGYETELQPFTIQEWDGGTSSLSFNDQVFSGDVHTFEGSINDRVTGSLVYVGLGSKDEVGDEVAGKIALIERASYTFYQ
ncbi:hypothetical protein R0J90_13170, partial [Micrococcus sp. SIMBA_144]